MDFKKFDEIQRLSSNVTITEKIHGTNAQITIYEEITNSGVCTLVKAGSRTRWLTVEDDNYGFARKVAENEKELIEALGLGTHYGEWYGSGINGSYGLTGGDKRLALFDIRRTGQYKAGALPKWVEVVPVLYSGPFKDGVVTEVMEGLKTNGSKIAPGYMKPEGIVVRFDRNSLLLKNVFEQAVTKWCGAPGDKAKKLSEESGIDVSPYLVELILEKVTSKNERLLVAYPETLPEIVKAYLEERTQEMGAIEGATARAVNRAAYPWVKSVLAAKGLAA